jgi:hypothetical protein
MAKKKTSRKVTPRKSNAEENHLTDDDDNGEDLLPAQKSGKKVRKTPKEDLEPEGEHDQPEVGRRTTKKRKSVDMDAKAAAVRKSKGQKAERGRLTKKGKANLEQWKGKNRRKKRDAYFTGLAESARKKFGHGSVLAGSDTNQLVVGIPMPSLALEWLIQQDVFPLSVIIMLVGKWRTCKSALLYEIFRWFDKCNGGAVLNEAETKFSPDLCQSIMGYEDDEVPIILNRCNSLDEWQKYLTFYLKEQKKQMIGTADEPGPGRTIPVCFGVDSVMGKSAEEKHEKISKEGSAGRAFPVEALMITEYIRAIAHELDNWPFSLVLINHLKTAITEEGGSERRKPGGDFASFQESFELETSIWKEKIDTAHFDGTGVRISCEKNSFGVTGRKIKTRMLWWDEEIGEDQSGPIYRQKTVFDWDWSTINFLNDLPPKYKARLKERDIDLDVKSPTADVECLARMKCLGMGTSDYLPWNEVGAMIRDNSDVMERIRNGLSIKRRAVMEGDYLEQLESLEDELE